MSALDHRLSSILTARKRSNRLRTLEANETSQGRQITIGTQRFVNFVSNDYLGLSAHPNLRDAARDAASKYGVGSGASALLSGRSCVHEELEKRLAKYLQRDSALLFSSGYMANLGVIAALVERQDHLFCDTLNHASLIDAVSLTKANYTCYPHVDVESLEHDLRNSNNPHKWIITDTLFSMDGDIAPLAKLAALAKTYDAVLVGDDAHGFGVLANGRGAAKAFDLDQSALPIQIVTFGKALGSAGAAVVGSHALIDTLIQAGRTFIYDTAPPPMIAAATIAALELVAGDPSLHRKLADNIAAFKGHAGDLPLLDSNTPIQPVMIGRESTALAIAASLRESGFYVRAIRPPTVPVGTARLRICLSAAHLPEDIAALASALKIAFVQHG